ncbi:MAG: response regulator transcription factor [Chloroflexi bacterium]|nr:response regulator transcription factor [Chloroflexota bacterium]
MNQPYAIVIEDDPQLSLIYMTALQQAGFDAALDINGDQYLTLLSAAQPDLVILDLHLPFADSAEVLNTIRAKSPKTMIAIVTADFIKAKTFEGKADHILIKPVSVARLMKIAETIREAK